MEIANIRYAKTGRWTYEDENTPDMFREPKQTINPTVGKPSYNKNTSQNIHHVTLIPKDKKILDDQVLQIKQQREQQKAQQAVKNAYWLREALKVNSDFKSLQDVMDWLQANGLVADGKFGEKSLAKWNESINNSANNLQEATSITKTPNLIPEFDQQMQELLYRRYKFGNDFVYKDFLGNTYFNNGRMRTNNGEMQDYNISKLSPMPSEEERENIWLLSNKIPGMYHLGKINPDFITWQNAYKQHKKNKFYKQGGIMNRINYFQQGGAAPQQNIQQQVTALVQAAMQGDLKATQTVNQIMEAAKAGDQQAMQLAQMIQQVAQQMQGQATAAKWGAKLRYIKSLKYARGGKTCPACMEKGGETKKDKKVKVAYKDIDKDTYQKFTNKQKDESDIHRLTYGVSNNKDGSYNISHNPSSKDSTTISRSIMSKNMSRKYSEKKECGGKAKKHYFGGWL